MRVALLSLLFAAFAATGDEATYKLTVNVGGI